MLSERVFVCCGQGRVPAVLLACSFKIPMSHNERIASVHTYVASLLREVDPKEPLDKSAFSYSSTTVLHHGTDVGEAHLSGFGFRAIFWFGREIARLRAKPKARQFHLGSSTVTIIYRGGGGKID